MPAVPSVQSALAVLRVSTDRPLGLLSLLLFLGGIAAFLIFRDLNPRASITSFWIVCVGCLGLAYEVSETMRLNPDLTRFRQVTLATAPADSPPPRAPATTSPSAGIRPQPAQPRVAPSSSPNRSSSAQASSPSPTSGGGGGSPDSGGSSAGSTKRGGTVAATGENDAANNGETATSGATDDKAAAPATVHWVADRVVSDERVTGNHKCADVPGAANPRACKTGYAMTLTCGEGMRLTAPQLRCVEGDCAASAIGEIRVSPDGRRVDARFEVWGTPTKWQLTAVRETESGR